jgi:hypothetical protein
MGMAIRAATIHANILIGHKVKDYCAISQTISPQIRKKDKKLEDTIKAGRFT